MEYRRFGQLDFEISALGLGTWVTGGWMWGGSDRLKAADAIESAIESGVTLIDTAPVYGFGTSESIVGEVVAKLKVREKIILATKCGLEWDGKRQSIRRNSSPVRILKEFDESRKRLRTDVIDIYQIHWPDESVSLEKSMEVLHGFYEKGLIRAIGVSNFSVEQMQRCLRAAPLHSLQPPYNLYERGIEKEILPFCRENSIAVLGYGALCRGLLSGKFDENAQFSGEDIRSRDPKFQKKNLAHYVAANRELAQIAEKKKAGLAQLAVCWALSTPGITGMLAGARTPEQARQNSRVFDLQLSTEEIREINAIVSKHIQKPITPAFMAPPESVPGTGAI